MHLPEVVADMVRVQRLTGCRPEEVCAVRPCDVDLSNDIWQYRPQSHKTEHHNRERVILIGPQAQAVLLKYLARDSQMYCFRPIDSEAKRRAATHAVRTTPLGHGNRPGTNRKSKPQRRPGDQYDVAAYRRAIGRACDMAFPHPTLSAIPIAKLTAEQLAELKKWQFAHRWVPNRLRHSAATEIRRQFGLEAAQVVLGHSKADVTQVYAERDLAKGIEIARRIG
jgi:integrase